MTANRFSLLVVALMLLGLGAGCVDRRYVVTSNAPGAHVVADGENLGPTPVDKSYVYTGARQFHLNAPGYEPLTQIVKFEPKWYDYPGLDLFAEVFWPFRIEDVRRVHFDLLPAQPVQVPVLQANANSLRVRGMQLPPASVPDQQDGPARPRRTNADGLQPLIPTGTTPIPQTSPGRFNGR